MKMKRFGRLLAIMMVSGAVGLQAQVPAQNAPASTPAAAIRRLFTEGRWREAAAALVKAKKEAPGDEDLQFMSAMVAMEDGNYAESMRLYGGLLEKYPDNAGLKNNVAWLRVKSNDPAIRNLDMALRLAQEAVISASQDYNIWNTLGEIYLARGDAMRAMRLAVLARDMAAMAGESDLRVYQDLVRRCEAEPAGIR
jgi:tetratricopeptide (TPR) repeat protein